MLIDITTIDKYRINKKEQFRLIDETALALCEIVAFR